jgi:hypothetical protein
MSALTPIREPSRLELTWEYTSDLLIVVAVIWALPLLALLVRMGVHFAAR